LGIRTSTVAVPFSKSTRLRAVLSPEYSTQSFFVEISKSFQRASTSRLN